LSGWAKAAWALLRDTALDSLRLWRIAIWVPLLVVVPEFIQHIVEINLGMFDSREAARALSSDPQRMLFGAVKIAGLFAAILAAVAVWTRRDHARPAWRAVGIAFGLNLLLTALVFGLGKVMPAGVWAVLNPILMIVTLPFLVLLVGALLGDATMTLRAAYRRGWLIMLRMALLLPLAWLPLQWLHERNHFWALGQASWAVWALMAFDALVVGLMACWAGTALHHAYRGSKSDVRHI
jgi:hypothetical protein